MKGGYALFADSLIIMCLWFFKAGLICFGGFFNCNIASFTQVMQVYTVEYVEVDL